MEGETARERSWLILNLANIITVMRLVFIPLVIWFIFASSKDRDRRVALRGPLYLRLRRRQPTFWTGR